MKNWLKGTVTAASLALAATPALAGKADDTLNVGFRLQLQSLDTCYSPGREGLLLGFWAYDALVCRDPTSFEFKPLLATAWRQIDELTLEGKAYPLGYSAGSDYVRGCHAHTVSTGNLTTWRWVGTNHHIAKVVDDLASLFGP